MREIRLSGSEGGVALTPPSLPLSLPPEQLQINNDGSARRNPNQKVPMQPIPPIKPNQA